MEKRKEGNSRWETGRGGCIEKGGRSGGGLEKGRRSGGDEGKG